MAKVGKRIAFIGAMGSGKSTLARYYTARYGEAACDTDDMFFARYGDISEYMRIEGEQAFREVEHAFVLQAIEQGSDVISCGGGVVLDKRNMTALRRACDIVFLSAPVKVLEKRIKDSSRPFKSDLKRIVDERLPLYKKYADYTVDTTGTLEDAVKRINSAVSKPRKNRYDILLCDADDTVLDFQKAMRTSIVNAARAVGIKASDEKIIAEFSDITRFVWRKLEDEGLTRDELDRLRFAMLKERLGEDFDVSAMSAAFFAEMKKTRFVINGAKEFLSDVRARGIKVYIITNGFASIARERLKAVENCVDGAFISDIIGYNKPDPRFFDYVFNELRVTDRSRAIVFGDGINSDIRGGIDSGIDTCHYCKQSDCGCVADYHVHSYAEMKKIL